MEDNMDNAKQAQTSKKHDDRKIPVTEVGSQPLRGCSAEGTKTNMIPVVPVGPVCVYCGTETEDACCGEIHHEIGYELESGELLLESELSQWHEIVEE